MESVENVEQNPETTADVPVPEAAPEAAPPQPPEPASPEPVTTPAAASPVVVIPRVLFNYVVIAVVCLVVGVVIGMFGYDRVTQQNQTNNEALINKAVATAVAALPSGSAARPDPNARNNVSIEGSPSLGPRTPRL